MGDLGPTGLVAGGDVLVVNRKKKERKIMSTWLPVLAVFTCKHVTAQVIIVTFIA